MNLDHTIKKSKTIEEAVVEIERLHGFSTLLEVRGDVSFDGIKKSIDKSLPVLLESGKGKWLVCCGYLMKEGVQELVVNDPEQTPMWQGCGAFTQGELESEDPWLRGLIRRRIREGKFVDDYELTSDKFLPAIGFSIEPFERGKYKTYFIHHWELSAEPLKADIMKILKLKDPPVPEPTNQPTGMWERDFKNRRYTVMGDSKLVPMTVIRAGGHISGLCAALASASCGKFGPQIGECGLDPKKFYRAARLTVGDDYEVELTAEERVALEKLCAAGRAEYEKLQAGRFDIRDCEQPYYRAALRFSATAESTGSLEVLLSRIARLHGWTAVVEGGRPLAFEEYQEALDKNIPILLQEPKGGGWLVGCGYTLHNGKPWLLLANPVDIAGSEYAVSNDRDFPRQGLFFEPFDQSRYVPHFIYGWERSAAAYAKEIAEIMKNHPKPAAPEGAVPQRLVVPETDAKGKGR